MTFIPEQVHSIPKYVTVAVYMIPGRNFIPCKSFRNEFIPIFNPNEILVQEWHHVNWKRTPSQDKTTNCGGTHFDLRAKKRDGLFRLAKETALWSHCLLKLQIWPSVGTIAGTIAFPAKLAPSLFLMWRENALCGISQPMFSFKCSTNFLLERNSFCYHVNSPLK